MTTPDVPLVPQDPQPAQPQQPADSSNPFGLSAEDWGATQAFRGDSVRHADEQWLDSMRMQVRRSPELEAELQRMEIDTGMPRNMLRADVEKAREVHRLWEIRQQDMIRTSPALHRAFHDPDFASLAHDDFAHLSFLEKVGSGFASGQEMVSIGELATKKMHNGGVLPEKEERRLQALSASLEERGNVTGWVGGPAQMVGQMVTPEMGATIALGGVASVAAAPIAVPAIIGAAAIGAHQAYQVEAGLAYHDMRQQGIAHHIAAENAAIVGTINAAIELGGLGVAAKPFATAARNIVRPLARRELVRRVTANALTRETVVRSVRRGVREYGLQLGSEVAQEVSQETTTGLFQLRAAGQEEERRDDLMSLDGDDVWFHEFPGGGEVSRDQLGQLHMTPDVYNRVFGGKVTEPQVISAAESRQVLEQLREAFAIETTLDDEDMLRSLGHLAAETAWHTVQSAAMLSGVGPTTQYLSERRRVRREEAFADQMADAAKGTEESKTAARAPQGFGNFLRSAWSATNMREVYLRRASVQRILDEQGLTVEEIEQHLPGVSEQMAADPAAHPHVVIDGGDFFANLRGTPLLRELMQEAAPDAETASPAERKERLDEIRALAEEAGTFEDETATAEDAIREDVEKIEASYLEQLRAAGTPYLRAKSEARFAALVWERKAEQATLARGELVLPTQLQSEFGEGGRVYSGEPGADVGPVIEQFIGDIGATAEQHKGLQRARALAKAGANAETIYESTGWFVGPDGKMRYELVDEDADWKVSPGELEATLWGPTNWDEGAAAFGEEAMQAEDPRPVVLLSDVWKNDVLFAAYPELANVRVQEARGEGVLGSFDEFSNTISLDTSRSVEQIRSTLMHEIQHWIQTQEGFARGGNHREMDAAQRNEVAIARATQSLGDHPLNLGERTRLGEWLKEHMPTAGSTQKQTSIAQMRDDFEEILKAFLQEELGIEDSFVLGQLQEDVMQAQESMDSAYRAYQDLGGEQEARLVQERDELRRSGKLGDEQQGNPAYYMRGYHPPVFKFGDQGVVADFDAVHPEDTGPLLAQEYQPGPKTAPHEYVQAGVARARTEMTSGTDHLTAARPTGAKEDWLTSGADVRMSDRANAESTSAQEGIDSQHALFAARTRLTPKKERVPGQDKPRTVRDENGDIVYENVRVYDGVPIKGVRGRQNRTQAILDHLVDNLVFAFNAMSPEHRERSRQWYDGANRIASELASRYGGVSERQVAGMLAAMSPQADWRMNVQYVDRLLDVLTNYGQSQMTPEAEAWLDGAPFAKKARNKPIAARIRGKTLAEVIESRDMKGAAMWIRAFSEAHHELGYADITPEGEFFGNVQTLPNKKGETRDAKIGWKSLSPAENAVAIFMDEGAIHWRIGNEHKVRNFFHNILDPNSAEPFATSDTHHVAVSLFLPIGAKALEVKQNMGSEGAGTLEGTGLSGTYWIYHQALIDAAARIKEETGQDFHPREIQSITWEAGRGLFVKKMKSSVGEALVRDIWREADRGKISRDEARARILAVAAERGGDANNLSWREQSPGANRSAESGATFRFRGDAPATSGRVDDSGGSVDGAGAGARSGGKGGARAGSVRRAGRRDRHSADRLSQERAPEQLVLSGPDRVEGRVLVEVDAERLQELADNALDKEGSSPIAGRRERFEQFLDGQPVMVGDRDIGRGAGARHQGEAIQAPTLDVSRGSVSFQNGRHRFSVLRERGIPVSVAVKPQDVRKLEELGVLQSQEDGETRGSFDPDRFRIFLHEKHDASTFLHELAHMSHEIDAEMIRRGEASAQQIADMETLLADLGDGRFFSVEDYLTATLDERRNFHEAIARSFEGYVFDGKAPTREVRRVFQRLSRWMVRVYQNVRERIDRQYHAQTGEHLAAMTPEVRAVFDRWLASQRQLDAARREGALSKLMTGEAMTDEENALVDDLVLDAEAEAETRLRKLRQQEIERMRKMRAKKLRELQRRGRRARAKLEREAFASLMQTEPVARLAHWLASGELYPENGDPAQVDRSGALPENRAKRALLLSDGRLPARYQTTNPDNALEHSPETLADSLGYESAAAMLDDLVDFLGGEENASVALQERVDDLADDRLMQEFPHLTDPETMEAEVDAAIANEATLRLRAAELSILDGRPDAYLEMVRVAKATAQQMVGELTAQDLFGHGNALRRYSVAAGRAEREALRARGDVAQMRHFQRVALLQRALAREAAAQRDQLQKAQEELHNELRFRARSGQREQRLADKYGGPTVETARMIGDALGMELGSGVRKPAPWAPWNVYPDTHPERLALEEDYADAEAMRGGRRLLQMTVDDANNMLLGMQGLLDRGRLQRVFEVDGKKVGMAELADRAEAQADAELAPPKPIKEDHSLTARLRGTLSAWRTGTQRLGPQLFAMDGDRVGLLYESIYAPVREAEDRYELARAEVGQLLLEKLQPIADKMTGDPELGSPITTDTGADGNPLLLDQNTGKAWVFERGKRDILGVMLYLGARSNAERLALGFRWIEPREPGVPLDLSPLFEQIEKWEAAGVITADDWKTVQGVWDIYDKHLLPDVQRAHFEVRGREMVTVEKGVQELGSERLGVTLTGGYVPAARSRELQSGREMGRAVDSMVDQMRMLPMVHSGFTQERVDEMQNSPLDIDPLRQLEHFRSTLLFVHMEPTLRRTRALLGNNRFIDQLERMAPGIMKNLVTPWLQTAATLTSTLPDAKGANPLHGLDWVATMRSNFGTSAMLGNMLNSLEGVTGEILALARVPFRFLAMGHDRRHMPKQDVYELSDAMKVRHTMKGMSAFEIQSQVAELLEPGMTGIRELRRVRQFLAKHTYIVQELVQKPLDLAVWRGAYLHATATVADKGLGLNAEQAIRHADAAVQATQSDLAVTALARTEKGNAFQKLFYQFFSWFIAMGSLSASATRDAKMGYRRQVAGDTPKAAAMARAVATFALHHVTLKQLATLAFSELIREALLAPGEPEDEDATFVDNWVWDPAGRTLLAAPRVFGPVGAVASSAIATLARADMNAARMPSPPTISGIGRMMRSGMKLYDGEDPLELTDALDAVEVFAAMALGIPIGQATQRVRRGFNPFDEEKHQEGGRSPAHWWRGVTGR